MSVVIFLVACCLTLTAAQLRLPCTQKATIQAEVRRCFSGLGESNLLNLDPTDKSGTMGQVVKILKHQGVCRREVQNEIVEGFGCYYDFYGNCLGMRKMLPTRTKIWAAMEYACRHTNEMDDPCLEHVHEAMNKCYMQKVEEREIDLLMKNARFKGTGEETCGFLKDEMKCLEKALNMEHCTTSTQIVQKTFMGTLMPTACSFTEGEHEDLLRVNSHNSKLRGLLMQYIKSRNPS